MPLSTHLTRFLALLTPFVVTLSLACGCVFPFMCAFIPCFLMFGPHGSCVFLDVSPPVTISKRRFFVSWFAGQQDPHEHQPSVQQHRRQGRHGVGPGPRGTASFALIAFCVLFAVPLSLVWECRFPCMCTFVPFDPFPCYLTLFAVPVSLGCDCVFPFIYTAL